METAVIIYRDLNGSQIRQNHKTGFYNANDLIDLYNKQAKVNGMPQKRIIDYLSNSATKEWQDKIMAETSLDSNVDKSTPLENGTAITRRGRVNGGTWMHPYLFIDFAMWINADFKFTCVKWLHDNLIQLRDTVGNGFKEVNQALFEAQTKYDPFAYSNEAKLINKLAFGSPDSGQRNIATKKQLELLNNLQTIDTNLIKQGLSYSQRTTELVKIKNLLQ